MEKHQHHQHKSSSDKMDHHNHNSQSMNSNKDSDQDQPLHHHDNAHHGMSADKNDKHDHHNHSGHHGHMIEDFRKRFWISLIITIPILLISPMLQHFVGLKDELRFIGDIYVLFALSSFVYLYGGWPFLKGLVDELKKKQPGMMTLIALAISVAYFYSSAVVFGVKGEVFFWELATLIDIMLLGHWIEMKSIMGASKALEELAKLMPDEAHKINRRW